MKQLSNFPNLVLKYLPPMENGKTFDYLLEKFISNRLDCSIIKWGLLNHLQRLDWNE